MRLLICDDHKPLVEALSMALTLQGQTVVATAFSPDEAVAAAHEHQPDACLLDVSFPHENGLTAIAGILDVSPDTQVVMLSGSISKDLVANAIAQGAHGFISKERPIGVIVEALEGACQGHLAVEPAFMPDMRRPHLMNGYLCKAIQHVKAGALQVSSQAVSSHAVSSRARRPT